MKFSRGKKTRLLEWNGMKWICQNEKWERQNALSKSLFSKKLTSSFLEAEKIINKYNSLRCARGVEVDESSRVEYVGITEIRRKSKREDKNNLE